MAAIQTTISPVDGSVFVERSLADNQELERVIAKAEQAFAHWRTLPLDRRAEHLTKFVNEAVADAAGVANELTMQMGRPIQHGAGEVRGWLERGHKMIELGPSELVDLKLPHKEGFTRFIRREPLGAALIVAPWNYPWLTAVNALVPALMAGNTVILKHSSQTPLVAERIAQAARTAGLPDGVVQYLHMSHEALARVIDDSRIAYAAFTGSVEGGHAIQQAAANRFIGIGLELGGKDPAYVCEDASLELAAVNLADGAFYNAGQSCCGIERIYVHEQVYDDFVDGLVAEVRKLSLGDPRDQSTTLGPVVRTRSAQAIADQVKAAVEGGAQPLLNPTDFPEAQRGLPYLAPQVLVGVDHSMEIMTEETFGPAVGVMKVRDDGEAIKWMNDSRYGLTASVWTADVDRAIKIGSQIDTGTWFMNRCDYLDPELAWVGVKDSGRGCTLSRLGYGQLTRPKSFHLKH